MSIGSATTGGVTAIRVSDLTIDGADDGIRIKSNVKLGGSVHDVEYSDVCIRNSRDPMIIDPLYDSSGHEVDGTDSNHPPLFYDIRLKDVTIQGGGNVTLKGLDASHLLNISLQNVFLDDPKSYKIAAAQARIQLSGSNIPLTGENVQVTGKLSAESGNPCAGRFVPFPVALAVK
jgi:polygalacturonase